MKDRAEALRTQGERVDAMTVVHWVIADMLRAVRIATNAAIPDLTYRRLPPVVPVTYAEVDGNTLRWTGDRYDVAADDLLHRITPDTLLSSAEVDRIGEAFAQITWGRPGATILDHVSRGDSAASSGDEIGAVLAYATACKIAVVNLVLALEWEAGTVASDAARDLRDVSVNKMVNSLCHRLGGTWSTDRPGIARDWRIDVADVRNRVIHGGSRPTHAELGLAHQAVGQLLQYIAKRLVAKWKAYPRTLSLFVSRQSVDLYASKKAHAQVVATIGSLATSSEVGFASWRHDYYAAAPR